MRDVLVLALVVVIILHAAYGAMVFGAGVIDFVANRLLYRAIRVLDGLAPDAVHSLVYGPAVASTTGAISGIAINKISDGGDIRAIVAAAVWVLASISFTVGFGALFAKRSGERRGVALMREKVRRAEISSMFKGGNVALADMERDLAAVRRLLRVGTRLAERSEALSPLRWIWHQQSVKRRLLLVLSIVLSGVELSILIFALRRGGFIDLGLSERFGSAALLAAPGWLHFFGQALSWWSIKWHLRNLGRELSISAERSALRLGSEIQQHRAEKERNAASERDVRQSGTNIMWRFMGRFMARSR
ncbi:hypothetical protein [Catenuloplanes indicus]|uniref:Uncharacterized protein n=1 Tax=Catenuloplanes indicus TaxID=137267 RepID=A0AAE3VZI4_9ACTN|nr:hypothetical protein [Catenuloplanes indicus]MDQ0366848.1 hypothetical protein [Catenuloplanes indicus]